jgi:NAD+ synthase
MRKYEFDAAKTKDEIITWIRNYFRKNGPDCNAVIGISGGKDSSIVAALCCEALGNGRVIGVLMPQGVQDDIDVARELVAHLGIKSFEINIAETVNTLLAKGRIAGLCDSKQARVNLPARIRMATLFMVSQSMNGRVANTCNASENFVGWQTVGGDGFGQFSPLSKLTVTEVKAVGRELDLPEKFIEKAPADGLTGKTDEDNFGFTYDFLDKYIRTGEFGGDTATAAKIDRMHEANLFKDLPMPMYDPSLFNWWG